MNRIIQAIFDMEANCQEFMKITMKDTRDNQIFFSMLNNTTDGVSIESVSRESDGKFILQISDGVQDKIDGTDREGKRSEKAKAKNLFEIEFLM